MRWWLLGLCALSCTRVLSVGDDLALRDTGDAGAIVVSSVSSFVPRDVTFVAQGELDDDTTMFAFVGADGLTVALEAPRSVVAKAAVEAPAGVAITTQPTPTVWVATSRGLEGFGVTGTATLAAPTRVVLPFQATTVRALSRTTVAAWDSTRLAVRNADGGVFLSTPFDSELFDVLQVAAGLSLPDGGREGDAALIALTARGAFAMTSSAPDEWRPFAFEKTGATVLKRLAVSEAGRGLGLTNDALQSLRFGTFGPAPDLSLTWLMTDAGDALQLSGIAGHSCAQVEGMREVSVGVFQLFCRSADGGLGIATNIETPTPLDRHLTAISSDARVMAGGGRALRLDPQGHWSWLTPAFEDVVSLLGSATRPILITSATDAGLEVRETTCATRQTPWLWCKTGGAGATRVHGKADWAMRDGLNVYDLDTGDVTARVVDAGREAAVAIFVDGTLVTATGREVSAGPLVATLPVGPITSLAGRPGRELFAVAAGQLFVVTAADGGWTSSEVDAGEALSVWSDGARGRALLRDGSVRLLPSGVEAVAPTNERFITAEARCGQTFAVSTSGLFQLVTSRGSTRWARISLSDVPPASFSRAQLLAEEPRLLVLLPDMEPRRLDFACAP